MKFNNKYSYFALLAFMSLILTGCPGESSSSKSDAVGTSISSATAANELTITIATPSVNIPYVSVTICAPGDMANCAKIDNIQLDTGSSGLRIMKSALPSNFTQLLTVHKDSANVPLAECMQFADGYSWGPLYKADLHAANEMATNIVIQVIDESTFNVPSDCASTGVAEDTPESFGANGVLGLSNFKQDCGPYCQSNSDSGLYYKCASQNCVQASLATTDQVHNPATFFAIDNNGILVTLPAISAAGQAKVTGSLFFGIGTENNNQLGSAKIFTVDSQNGYLTTIYKNKTYDQSFFDTGSNGIYFQDISIAQCKGSLVGFYCPGSTLNLTATVTAAAVRNTTGASASVNFSVASVNLLNQSNYAFNDFAGITPDSLNGTFDWGLPFFFGRKIFTAFEDSSTPVGNGPYIAF